MRVKISIFVKKIRKISPFFSDQSARIRAHISEVSDDFFDLTIQDAKILLRDARKMQKELDSDGGILMTQQMRQAQKEGEKLSLLNKYKRSVIRVQLPGIFYKKKPSVRPNRIYRIPKIRFGRIQEYRTESFGHFWAYFVGFFVQ